MCYIIYDTLHAVYNYINSFAYSVVLMKVSIGLEETVFNEPEGAVLEVCAMVISNTPNILRAVTVNLQTVDGTATMGEGGMCIHITCSQITVAGLIRLYCGASVCSRYQVLKQVNLDSLL